MHFQMRRALSSLCLGFILIAGCGQDAFPKPELLNHPQSEWPARTKTMTSKQLFDVYRYYLSLKPPYDSSFADYLGLRGKEAVILWVESLEKGQSPPIDRPYLYGPIIQMAYYKGGYDLCADPKMLNRAATALIRPQVARSIQESTPLIQSQCVDRG